MDLSENCITCVPGQLGDCSKLKELNLKGNKLADRKLLKLIDQGKQKSIVDYIKNHSSRGQIDGQEMTKNTNTSKPKGKDDKSVSQNYQSEELLDCIKILRKLQKSDIIYK